MGRPIVIAHRGATARAPENSLAALRAASEIGAGGVEIDVRATADGALVVHHDARLGDGVLADMPVAAVREIRLPNGERIATLAEALGALDPGLAVFIELKALPAACDDAFLAALEAGPAPLRYAVHSFDHRIIRRLAGRRPDLPRGVLACAHPVRPLEVLRDAGASCLWQEHGLLDAELVAMLHADGGTVYAWTVNVADDMRRCVTIGVDGLCTDVPELAMTVVGP